MHPLVFIVVVLLPLVLSTFMVSQAKHLGIGLRSGNGGQPTFDSLSPFFYDFTCPQANYIVLQVLKEAMAKDPRMPASLLRLHFHDCFVQGCDASILLDDSKTIASEKSAAPNRNSARGFEVIDDMKAMLEEACPGVVSCADILALAARHAVSLWRAYVGTSFRKEGLKECEFEVGEYHHSWPNFNLTRLVNSFKQQGLDEVDLVALSGAHTIGLARCITFKNRLYNQSGSPAFDVPIETVYAKKLKSKCPPRGGDNKTSPLDYPSPRKFDNSYFKLLRVGRGLLNSDQILFSGNNTMIAALVQAYSKDAKLFFAQFVRSMVKMGSISPLVGSQGEIRTNCRRVN